jgi:integrase
MARRDNQEATYYLRADGRWEGKLELTSSSNERHRLSRHGKTEHEAKGKIEELIELHSVHDLRHSFAANHLNNGTPILALSRMLGHATAAFTLDRYGHLSTETQDAAAALRGRLLQEMVRLGRTMAEVA